MIMAGLVEWGDGGWVVNHSGDVYGKRGCGLILMMIKDQGQVCNIGQYYVM